MSYLAASFVQRMIRRLPYKQDQVVQLLGDLTHGRTRAIVNSARMTLDLREAIQRSMFLGTYEPTQTDWFRRCLRPGDVAVDVGASFGYYTTLSSRLVGSAGRVFAFEPSPVASRVIENAIIESHIDNVVLTKAALGRKASRVPLFLSNTPELHSPSILPFDEAYLPFEIEVLRLDDFEPLTTQGRIRLLKMDVEGYEPDVLDGMTELVKSGRVENIICEFNSFWLARNSTTPQALLESFLRCGFEIREKTIFQKDLIGRHGKRFDLQDIWFARPRG
jgi:FkbM family methyltransferase